MPSVRVERLPVQAFGLGVLGFDHLQLVYQPGKIATSPHESDWFVIEGVREPWAGGVRLAVEGRHGGTTLAEANGGAYGADLEAKIGTAATRGSIEIAAGPAATRLWATLTAHALDIDAQNFPYIAYALPSSPLPSVNSSSLFSSLLYNAGIDIEQAKPRGLRFSPGTETLLGSSGDDILAIEKRFSAVMGGDGSDWLTGTFGARRVDKLYGGKGDDRILWSAGSNVVHGGQPELSYADDGLDTADYSGVGHVTIRANARPVPHLVPDYVATFAGGEDQLFSIEEIVWDGSEDRVVLEDGVHLVDVPFTLNPGREQSRARGDTIDFSLAQRGVSIRPFPDGSLSVADAGVNFEGTQRLVLSGVEWLIGSQADDEIQGSPNSRGIDGGAGNDVIDARNAGTANITGPRDFDTEIDGGPGRDIIISSSGRTFARGGSEDDTFVLGPETTELVIADADAGDRLLLPRYDSLRFDVQAGDLLVRVTRGGREDRTAMVRILDFREGDLGMSLADPALPRVPPTARVLPGVIGLNGQSDTALIYPQCDGLPLNSPHVPRPEPAGDSLDLLLLKDDAPTTGLEVSIDVPEWRGE